MTSTFTFGVATSSYQIEGGVKEGGRTPCIWDTYAQEGNIYMNQDGSVACDHYHHYKEDIALMKELGVNSYRFSIAWPRIFPKKGEYNPEGMQFYKNIIAELNKNNILPCITLYHWDLPQWAQDLQGWENRECTQWFLEYADKCFEELDPLLPDGSSWVTHNEPWCAAFLGYYAGCHAPGKRSLHSGIVAGHHILLSHGLAVQRFRSKFPNSKHLIGITLNLAFCEVFSSETREHVAYLVADGMRNRWWLEPLFNKRYPDDTLVYIALRTKSNFLFIQEGDFDIISTPIDFLGLNYYNPESPRYNPQSPTLTSYYFTGRPQTDMGWDIVPSALIDTFRLIRQYTQIPIFVLENGSAWQDKVEEGKKVNDQDRIDYLLQHLDAVEKANKEGLNIRGYYCWSFMDNFEWALGYSKRFGLVYIDFETQERIPKESFYAYQKYIKEHPNGI